MLEITHQKAHALLRASGDQLIDAEEISVLDAHLAKCKECSNYAKSFASLEEHLRKTLHARWDNPQPDINLQAILHPSPAKLSWNNFLSQVNALGKVAILAALLLGYILIANLFGIQLPMSADEMPTMIPTPNELVLAFVTSPTPPAQFTLTGLSSQACETLVYTVQGDDTLESIAMQHGTTKEAILEHNKENIYLASNTVVTGMELVIPLCKGTPSQTATTTITPIFGTILPVQPE